MKPRMSGMADDGPRLDCSTGRTSSASMSRVEAGHLGGGQVEVVHAELAGLGEERVVDVGDVAHAARVVAEVAQPALQHVVGDVRRRRGRGGSRRTA